MRHCHCIVITLLALLLAGCAEYTAISNSVKGTGAAAYDQALSDAEFVICYAASVGSVRRRYGVTQEMADTYHKLCSAEGRIVRPGG